ncbi:serine/arginine repetitive matrix protein 1-like [Cucumis melo var. makuwa]|uniref:Serine/arginine repetitive matrix protein 1-like n=1 Tax=Cucumis melo var. makuwa TaxID=1194695 RepID=A0A5D3C531_CUCMM|nr:serine/arginine repetitive matrix protein 1-like [Cucumis melo var. makuwa]TYK07043.1 serine/arginine repetitive matrix protein 1-like [Cucumis melo var. makuwa]
MPRIKHAIDSQFLLHWYWASSHFTANSASVSPRALDRGQPHTLDKNRRSAKPPSPGWFDTDVENVPDNRTPEEETVKEVLSETPIAKPCSVEQTSPKKPPEQKVKASGMDGSLVKGEESIVSVSETSQVTEWCSNMSESVSMATTISEQREGDEASSKSREIGRNIKPKIRRKRPCSGDLSYRREQRDKCATKRPAELLPEKKSRVNCRYSHGTTESREARTRKLNGVQHEQQSGVSHGRRSRSPAARTVKDTNKTGNMKSSVMKMTGQAGDQQETVTTENRDEGKLEKPMDGSIQPPNESIENPLVSLECFIFL